MKNILVLFVLILSLKLSANDNVRVYYENQDISGLGIYNLETIDTLNLDFEKEIAEGVSVLSGYSIGKQRLDVIDQTDSKYILKSQERTYSGFRIGLKFDL